MLLERAQAAADLTGALTGKAVFIDANGAAVLLEITSAGLGMTMTTLMPALPAQAALAISKTYWAVTNGTLVALHRLPAAESPASRRNAIGSGSVPRAMLAFGCPLSSCAILDDGAAIAATCASGRLAVVMVGSGAVVVTNATCTSVRTMGDLNGDGFDDVMCGESGVALVSGETRVVSAVVNLALRLAVGLVNVTVAPIGDHDGDGVPDVAVSAMDGVRIITLRRDGSARASAHVSHSSAVSAASVGDINGDGINDLLIAGNGLLVVANVSCPQCARAYASDASATRGISAGDTLVVQFPCAIAADRGPVNASALGSYIRLSSSLGSDVTAVWQTASSFALTLVNTTGQLSAATRVGELTVTSTACGGAVYAVAGSWGPYAAAPRILSAVALNTGGQPGLGVGDSVLVTMDVDTDAASVLGPHVSLGGTIVTWVDERTWRILIVDASSAADPALTRVGAALVSGVVRSADWTSPSGTASAVLTGSWGNFPAPEILSAIANDTSGEPGLGVGDTIAIKFDRDTSTPRAESLLEFSASVGEFNAKWVSRSLLLVTILNVSSAEGAKTTRVGTLQVRFVGDLRTVDLSSPLCSIPAVVYGSWGNSITGITHGIGGSAAAQRLATAGGQMVALALAASLGSGGDAAGPVSATYSNGAFSFTATDCTVVATGVAIQCVTVAGVGAGFVWTVSIWHAPLPVPTAVTGYAAPVITNVQIVAPDVGTTYGGQLVYIFGSSFGFKALSAVGEVVFYPRGYKQVVFAATSCRVTTDDSVVTCRMPPSAGSNFVFSMDVGGQLTTDVTLPVLSPLILAVLAPPLTSAGGSRVRILGKYFGVPTSVPPSVTYGGPSLSFAATNCSVVTPQEEIECVSAPGYGIDLLWQVSVLGVTSNAFVSKISHASPVIMGVTQGSTPVPTAGGAVVVQGFNFPAAYPAVIVSSVDGVVVPSSRITTTSITVSVPAGVGPQHTLIITVSDEPPSSMSFAYAAPAVTRVQPFAGGLAFWDVELQGSNFGSVASAVNISVSGVPCVVQSLSDSRIVCRTIAMSGGSTTLTVSHQSADGVPNFSPQSSAPNPSLTPGTVSVVASGDPRAPSALPLDGGSTVRLGGSGLGGSHPTFSALLQTGAVWDDVKDCPRVLALRNASRASDFCVGTVAWTPTSATCTLPPSRRALVYLAAVDLWFGSTCYPAQPVPVAVRYDPAVVLLVEPASLQTHGGERLSLIGTGFPDDASVAIGGAVCMSTSVTGGTSMQCTSPPGVNANTSLSVASSAYPTGRAQSVRVGYLPPLLSRVDPRLAPCAGGALARITGEQLGYASAVAVTAGSFEWTVVNVSADGRLAFALLPPGVGMALDVSVRVGDQVASLHSAFSYAAPVVYGSDSSYVDAAAGGSIVVSGMNFVPLTVNVSALAVTIDGTPCTSARRLSDTAIACTSPPLLVRHSATLVVTIDGQSGYLDVPVLCPPQFYGTTDGAACRACPTGAVCAGTYYGPFALAGYTRVSGGAAGAFVACVPPESCVAEVPVPAANGSSGDSAPLESNCEVGYSGAACRYCAPGYYRNSGAYCAKCSSLTKVYLVVFVVAIVLVGVLVGYMQKRQYNLQGLSIGMDLFQTLAMFKGFAFSWPGLIDGMLSAATVSTFSIDIVSPECTISVSYSEKWVVIQLFPPIMCVILAVGIVLPVLLANVRRCIVRRGHADFCNGHEWAASWDGIVGGVLAVAYYSYFMLVSHSLHIFACTRAASGQLTLNSDPSIACWTPGSMQMQLLPFAVLSLFVYGAGIPLAFALLLHCSREAVHRDQSMWLMGRGSSRLDNPDFSIRRRIGRLYQDYRVEVRAIYV